MGETLAALCCGFSLARGLSGRDTVGDDLSTLGDAVALKGVVCPCDTAMERFTDGDRGVRLSPVTPGDWPLPSPSAICCTSPDLPFRGVDSLSIKLLRSFSSILRPRLLGAAADADPRKQRNIYMTQRT